MNKIELIKGVDRGMCSWTIVLDGRPAVKYYRLSRALAGVNTIKRRRGL